MTRSGPRAITVSYDVLSLLNYSVVESYSECLGV